jgi:hypothetical protein
MIKNVGGIDKIARILLGLVLIAYAIPLGFGKTGYNWVGWIGVVPLVTGLIGNCPLYSIFGFSSCPVEKK